MPSHISADNIKTSYLILYNVVSCAGWFYVLVLILSELIQNGDFATIYDRVGWPLLIVQTGAILELVHVIFGFVRSPLLTTAFQVASRLFLVWGVVDIFPEVQPHWAFTTMTIAWSITEIIRYSYYAFNLAGFHIYALLWCRYTFFFILYPLGAGSESILVYKSLPYSEQLNIVYYWIQIVILFVYAPGFYMLYTHMIGQRKRYLFKGKDKVQKIN
ncbi:PTPLA-domain-containing protein [Gigaspora margarita]|uniref:Very-long-chain (3R)-3-hydroxyacyl-CoA dehydratase n=1 Tax=Gigaspora margarita TaxID=4874 RepID=A0A8H4EUC3_GIGMA|nr:PTPLA-domain-containing protein [Gigaspora margarita]